MSLSFFFSSRRRHTRCALVTGVQTCALPILYRTSLRQKKRAAEATPDLPQRCGRALFGLQRQPAKTLVEARDLAALIEQTAVAAGPCRVHFWIDVELHRIAFLSPGGTGFKYGAVGNLHLDGVIDRKSV